MEKKKMYVSPSEEVINVELTHFLCASDMDEPSRYQDDFMDDENFLLKL